ncbi:MAG TPA: hypothetical protein VK783_09060 [Bacteroidia bacterium]|jgi:hypothetical protein|nr:hypothetical protein [Bacteroidia bacterium]
MRKILVPLAIIVIACFNQSFVAGDGSCATFFPAKQGAQVELKNYDNKDKLTGRCVVLITDVATSGSNLTINIKNTTFDSKDKQLGETKYSAKCENGIFYQDMASTITAGQAFGDRKVTTKVTGDLLEFPSDIKPGMDLKGGVMTVTTSMENMPTAGPIVSTITFKNRKAVSDTTVTTSAGTFNCIKMVYDENVKTKMTLLSSPNNKSMMSSNESSSNLHVITCYAKNAGAVRTETFDEKGKSMGYCVLSSISGN